MKRNATHCYHHRIFSNCNGAYGQRTAQHWWQLFTNRI